VLGFGDSGSVDIIYMRRCGVLHDGHWVMGTESQRGINVKWHMSTNDRQKFHRWKAIEKHYKSVEMRPKRVSRDSADGNK
jgi:hypothetical protein